jgi:NDP-sugar pyrophosphorylase family protein
VIHALPLLGEDFFVLHGDSYLLCSFAQVQTAYQHARRPALMTVLRNDNRWGRSNVLFVDGNLIAYDKSSPHPDMRHIDYGVSIFSREVFASYADRKGVDLAEICTDLSQRGQLASLEVVERFYEIGSFEGMRETEAYLSHNRIPR